MNRADDFAAVERLAERLWQVTTERISLEHGGERVCRSEVVADRDSPAADVSAMDGFALRLADIAVGREIPVIAQSVPGQAPPPAPPEGSAVMIFTGAVVPHGCDLVVRREEVYEIVDPAGGADGARGIARAIRFSGDAYRAGENIRRRGENAKCGAAVLRSGMLLHAGRIAAAANFGAASVEVARRVRVRLIITGNELRSVREGVQSWEIRDSNGQTLQSLLSRHAWIEVLQSTRCGDDLEHLAAEIGDAASDADAVILTGGVSQGDFDFVPAAIRRAGGEIVFHKLPIRPGKPICGGLGSEGQLILGLPGNPVSVAVGAVRFAIPLLRRIAGIVPWQPSVPSVVLGDPLPRKLSLHWFPLVTLSAQGQGELVPSQGSGDVVALAHSDGFVGIEPEAEGTGPWPYWSWEG